MNAFSVPRILTRCLVVTLMVLALTAISPGSAWALPYSDGSLDRTFDEDGKVTTEFGSSAFSDYAQSIAIQSDGKAVVAGNSNSGSDTFSVARYNVDGSLDSSFDGDGKVTTSFGQDYNYANSVGIQPDGRIVVAGHAWSGSSYDFAVARYNPNGSLDPSFDGDGKVMTDVSFSSDDLSYSDSIGIGSDGGITVGGMTQEGSNYVFALVHYNADGSLDTTFSSDGKVTTAAGSFLRSIAVQADNKIVAGGRSLNGTDYDFALVRYDTDGSLDTTFDGDGKVTTDLTLSAHDELGSVAIQSDGKIVAGGSSGFSNSTDSYFALARYNINGSLDQSFDGDGKVETQMGSSTDLGHSVAIQSDDKIVLGGESVGDLGYDFSLARYNPNGSLDPTFDGDGKVRTTFGSSDDRIYSVATTPDDKIVAAGYRWTGSRQAFAIARYSFFVNRAPEGADNTVVIDEETSYTFAETDFGFSDADGNSFAGVRISTLPSHGTLKNSGIVVSAQDFISAASIASGALTFDPVTNANGSPYASFTFQVKDDGGLANEGVDADPSANTMTIDVTPVAELDADGDSVPDTEDNCADTASGAEVDGSGCAAAQRDTDSDGVNDADDTCGNTGAGPVDASGCSAAQRDTDSDGVSDANDLCPAGAEDQDGVIDGDGCPDERYATQVSIRYLAGSDLIKGRVRAPDYPGCRSDRTVLLKKRVWGENPVLRTTTSDSDGTYSFRLGERMTGELFAKVRRRVLPAAGDGTVVVCRRARSANVRVR